MPEQAGLVAALELHRALLGQEEQDQSQPRRIQTIRRIHTPLGVVEHHLRAPLVLTLGQEFRLVDHLLLAYLVVGPAVAEQRSVKMLPRQVFRITEERPSSVVVAVAVVLPDHLGTER